MSPERAQELQDEINGTSEVVEPITVFWLDGSIEKVGTGDLAAAIGFEIVEVDDGSQGTS
jgi:hypothetical protein